MSYQRIGTPKIYTDNINWLLTLGKINSSNISVSGLSLASGSDKMGLFDMKPSNLQTITANTLTDTGYITINTGISTDSIVDNTFVAILGHNFKQAGVKFQIEQSDNNFTNTFDVGNQTEVINATYDSGYHTPERNGWSLVTFTDRSGDNDNQYWRIRLEPSGSSFTSDIKIGAILLGESILLPQSPDLAIKKKVTFDGVSRQTSVGGQTYANAQYLSGADWFIDPLNLHTSLTSPDTVRKTGRTSLDMSFSYLADTDVYIENSYNKTNLITGNNISTNLLSKTHGGMIPNLLQYDSSIASATDTDSFLWCRLNNEPSFTQVANRVWNTSLSFIEEF